MNSIPQTPKGGPYKPICVRPGPRHLSSPQNAIHVGREAVYLPIDEGDFWRVLLVKALEALRVEGV